MNTDITALTVDRTAFAVALLDNESDDIEYWSRQSFQARWQYIEQLRQINYGDEATKRLQRVLEVVEFTSS